MIKEFIELSKEWENILPCLESLYLNSGMSKEQFDIKIISTKEKIKELSQYIDLTEKEIGAKGLKQIVNVEIKKMREEIFLVFLSQSNESIKMLKEKNIDIDLYETEFKDLLRFRSSLIEKDVLERAKQLNDKLISLTDK